MQVSAGFVRLLCYNAYEVINMYKRGGIILTALLLGIVIPGVIFSLPKQPMQEETKPTAHQEQTQSVETVAKQEKEYVIPILMEDGTVQNMQLNEYITGVVLREMPASFEAEALKAQAVVARTYALKQYASAKKHPGCAACTDSNCCQGFWQPEGYLSSGGDTQSLDKIRQAVEDTKDLVLQYEGKLIDATYFSCSGGKTEDACAVWGSDVPYLQSVESPGEEKAEHYTDTVTYSLTEFQTLLGAEWDGPAEAWIGSISYTDGGGVAEIEIGEDVFDGVTLRRRLGLRSTAFAITVLGDTVTVTTKGYGHRVGMSQYGADSMAVGGSDFRQILSHYYPGTELVSLDNN